MQLGSFTAVDDKAQEQVSVLPPGDDSSGLRLISYIVGIEGLGVRHSISLFWKSTRAIQEIDRASK